MSFVFLVCLLFVFGGGPGGGALLRDTAGGSLPVGAVGGEVNVLFRGSAHVEGGHVHELASDTNVALPNQDAGVVDGLGESLFVDLGLQAALQELLGGELKDTVELEFVVGQKTVAGHAAQQRCSLKDALGVLRVERQQRTCGLSELGEGKLHPPNLTLAPQTVLANELQLGVETLLLVWTTRSLEGLTVCHNNNNNKKLRVSGQVPQEKRSLTPTAGSGQSEHQTA